MEEESYTMDQPVGTSLSMDVDDHPSDPPTFNDDEDDNVVHPMKLDPPARHEEGEGDGDDEEDEEEAQRFIQLARRKAKHQVSGLRRVKKEVEPSEEKENEVGDEESNLIMGGRCEKKAFCLLDGIFEVRNHGINPFACFRFFVMVNLEFLITLTFC
jgi:hypothetical protein